LRKILEAESSANPACLLRDVCEYNRSMSQATAPKTTQAAAPAVAADGPSPTVRVMRLYKPPLNTIPCLQQLSTDELLAGNKRKPTRSTDFTISPFLMLPDSFGDIYLGEFFSAYIAVINGVQDLPYHNVTLSARLQTLNATHDLFDSRAIQGKESGREDVLNTGEATDMVVQHTLSELGTHTLRVTVYYTDSNTKEPKTLRKFYRFNVLNPLTILVASYDLTDRFLIQCQVTNITKVLIHIQEVLSHRLLTLSLSLSLCLSLSLSLSLRLTL
jgi:trafficking protein particle complex subunit 13